MSIELEHCSFTYPGTGIGVHDITLDADEGQLIAVIGASGSGKTTLLKLVAGFEQPAHGRIRICGKDMTGVPARKREIGVVFQSYALFPLMRCVDNVAYPLKIRGVDRALRQRRALEMLDKVGLAGRGDNYPARLSGGQQQRVALARALVFQPSVLLLDEPLSAIDAGLRAELRKQIRLLQREHRITALHVTHDQEEALSMGDKIALMDSGRIIQCGTPHEIYDAPVNRTVADFVGQANFWDGEMVAADRVRIAFGELVCRGGEFAAGKAVTVMVRPENVRLNPVKDGAINYFPGKLALDTFLGSLRRFEFIPTGSGKPLVLGETSDRSEPLAVSIPPEKIRLLPKD